MKMPDEMFSSPNKARHKVFIKEIKSTLKYFVLTSIFLCDLAK